MRNKILLTSALFFFTFSGFGQDVKIGYTNVEYLITQMPEYVTIENELKEYGDQLDKQLQAKMQEFQTKMQDLEQNIDNMLPEVARDKQEELQTMEQSIRKFQMELQQSIQRKQNDLLQSVYSKIEKAIQEVAKADGYTHVFSEGMSGVSILLYADDGDNITDKVLKNMGITAEENTLPGN